MISKIEFYHSYQLHSCITNKNYSIIPCLFSFSYIKSIGNYNAHATVSCMLSCSFPGDTPSQTYSLHEYWQLNWLIISQIWDFQCLDCCSVHIRWLQIMLVIDLWSKSFTFGIIYKEIDAYFQPPSGDEHDLKCTGGQQHGKVCSAFLATRIFFSLVNKNVFSALW